MAGFLTALFGQLVPLSSPTEFTVLSNTPTLDRLLEQSQALAPADRFIDVSWDEWRALLRETPPYMGFPDHRISDKGFLVRPHVYVRPPALTPPVDPELVAEMRELTRATDALLRKMSASA